MVIFRILLSIKILCCAENEVLFAKTPANIADMKYIYDDTSQETILTHYNESLQSYWSSFKDFTSSMSKYHKSFEDLLKENSKMCERKTVLDDYHVYFRILCQVFCEDDKQLEVTEKIKTLFNKLSDNKIQIKGKETLTAFVDDFNFSRKINEFSDIKRMINIFYLVRNTEFCSLTQMFYNLSKNLQRIVFYIGQIKTILSEIHSFLSDIAEEGQIEKEKNDDLIILLVKNKDMLECYTRNIVWNLDNICKICKGEGFEYLENFNKLLKNVNENDLKYLTRIPVYLKIVIPLHEFIQMKLSEINNSLFTSRQKEHNEEITEELFGFIENEHLLKNTNNFITSYSCYLHLNDHMKVNLIQKPTELNLTPFEFIDTKGKIEELVSKIKKIPNFQNIVINVLNKKEDDLFKKINEINLEILEYFTSLMGCSKEKAINLINFCKSHETSRSEKYNMIEHEIYRCISWRTLVYMIHVQSLYDSIYGFCELFGLDCKTSESYEEAYNNSYIFDFYSIHENDEDIDFSV